MISTSRFCDDGKRSASLSPFNSGGIFRFFIMTDSGGQIIGVTSAFILIFSFSVDSENETISYVFLVLWNEPNVVTSRSYFPIVCSSSLCFISWVIKVLCDLVSNRMRAWRYCLPAPLIFVMADCIRIWFVGWRECDAPMWVVFFAMVFVGDWLTDCLNFWFLSFDMMSFVLDFLVFLRKLKYGVSSYISYIDLLSSVQFSCVWVQDSLDIFVGVEG